MRTQGSRAPGIAASRARRGRQGVGGRGAARVQGALARDPEPLTHLAELEGGDDGDNDAHETDVEPIPVGQAGIGLSLQELEQHHHGRRHATPRGARARARARAAASVRRHAAVPTGPPAQITASGRRALQLRRLTPARLRAAAAASGSREPGAHAHGAAEADLHPARQPAPPWSGRASVGGGGGGGSGGPAAPPGGRKGEGRRAPSRSARARRPSRLGGGPRSRVGQPSRDKIGPCKDSVSRAALLCHEYFCAQIPFFIYNNCEIGFIGLLPPLAL